MKAPAKVEPWPMLSVVVPAVLINCPLVPTAPELAAVVCSLMVAPVMRPAPVMVPVPLVSRVTVPVLAPTVPPRVIAPVFWMLIWPATVLFVTLAAVMLSAPLLVSAMLPLLALVAVKPLTVFAPFSVVPVAEEVASVAPEIVPD